ncbi:MAG: hypothetical protein JXA30_02600 [Deltaproteobacteria bacterium]|nr:hypothetical protein [Deltaproteobacteria bacterium]
MKRGFGGKKVLCNAVEVQAPRRFNRFAFLWCIILLIHLSACSDEPEPVQMYSFERPEKVALACFKVSKNKAGDSVNTPKPLEKCLTRKEETPYHLHALVTQTSRGEVATVDLIERQVVDTRPDIPGITFVSVGEVPKAIVVPRIHAEMTYVASYASRDLLAIPTKIFRPDDRDTSRPARRTPIEGRPVDMVISPDERFLYLTVPEIGALIRLSICRELNEADPSCSTVDDLGSITKLEKLTLPGYQYGDLREIQASISRDANIKSEAYQYTCNYNFEAPVDLVSQRDFADLFGCVQAINADSGALESIDAGLKADAGFEIDSGVEPETGVDDDASLESGMPGASDSQLPPADSNSQCRSLAPRPTAIAVDKLDEQRYRLLIADEVLPVIHRIDFDSEQPDAFMQLMSGETDLPEPIVTAVPVRDFVVTPSVPRTIPRSYSEIESAESPVSDSGVDARDWSESYDAEVDAGLPLDASLDAEVDGGDEGRPESEGEAETAGVLETVKYIYAIDHLDGSVLVVDALTGAVLAINSEQGARTDRLALNNATATALEIVTPDYDQDAPNRFHTDLCRCGRTEELAPAPNQLFGVYLLVATTDGYIRTIDVHDMNSVALRECRHSACMENGKRAFLKDPKNEIIQDENGNGSYVLDFVSYAADFCSKNESCAIESSSDDYVEELNDSECKSCCKKAERGDQRKNERFVENLNELCDKCVGREGDPIDYDAARCLRCVDENGDDIAVAIRRHYPRLSSVGTTGAPLSKPQFVIDERAQAVNDNGKSYGMQENSLLKIECDDRLRMAQSFPDVRKNAKKVVVDQPSQAPATDAEAGVESSDAGTEDQPIDATEEAFVYESGNAFVCASTDPWTANREDWVAQYEGAILGAVGNEGKFVDSGDEEYVSAGADSENGDANGDTIQFRASSGTSFCRVGVLGKADVKPGFIAITSEPETDDEKTGNGDCALLKPPILFSIRDGIGDDGKTQLIPQIDDALLPQGIGGTADPVAFVRGCMANASKVYTYQVLTAAGGLVPGLAFARGRFAEEQEDPTALTFIGEVGFEPSGDLLVITSEPQPDEVIDAVYKGSSRYQTEDCKMLTEMLSNGYAPRVAFEIQQAFDDYLVISPMLVEKQLPEKQKRYKNYEFIEYCMAKMLMQFEVRTHNAYTVQSSGLSSLHDVTAGDDRSCRPGNQELRSGRAYDGVEYRNSNIAFKLAHQDEESKMPGFRLVIQVYAVPKLMVGLGTLGYPYPDYGNLPVTMLYESYYNIIFVVDMGLRGLVPIQLTDWEFPDTLSALSGNRYQ